MNQVLRMLSLRNLPPPVPLSRVPCWCQVIAGAGRISLFRAGPPLPCLPVCPVCPAPLSTSDTFDKLLRRSCPQGERDIYLFKKEFKIVKGKDLIYNFVIIPGRIFFYE